MNPEHQKLQDYFVGPDLDSPIYKRLCKEMPAEKDLLMAKFSGFAHAMHELEADLQKLFYPLLF